MTGTLAAIRSAIARRWLLWGGTVLGFILGYNLLLLAALVVRFGELPNYATVYDYPANVMRILASTPSLLDALQIIREEWLIEIGFMNYQFGNGISEWSLTVLPAKLAVLLAVGALLATVVVLVFPGPSAACATGARGRAIGVAGGGAALVGFSSASLSWVVCCAAPTWVVSLAMLGMSVSLAFWLEPFGHVITGSGFALLLASVVVLARRRESDTSNTRPAERAGTRRLSAFST
jgi:hypothetical protein